MFECVISMIISQVPILDSSESEKSFGVFIVFLLHHILTVYHPTRYERTVCLQHSYHTTYDQKSFVRTMMMIRRSKTQVRSNQESQKYTDRCQL
jgi:hypothetical protein